MSSSKIQNPNAKSNGFVWALVALLVIVVAVVAYIVVNGKNNQKNDFADWQKESVSFNVSTEDNAIVLKSENAKKDAQVVEVYEDYSCPHCADLAEATDAEMKEKIEDGSIIVEIRSLNFLDNSGNNTGTSTLAGAAAHAVAESGDAEAYWNTRVLFMQEQSTMYGTWDNARFANTVRQMGADDATISAIENGDAAKSFPDVATKNAEKLNKETGTVSSPRVIIDGKEYEGRITEWLSAIK